jgi:tRNA-splicing ligase RtcB
MSRTEAKGKINRKTGEVKSKGKIDWNAALDDLKAKRIHLRGGAADEAPLAYKRLEAVLDAHSAYVEKVTRLHPVGVAMAGPNTHDPYKD